MNESANLNSKEIRASNSLPPCTILGIRVDDRSLDEVIATCEHWLQTHGQHFITTPNPEMLVAATKNNDLRHALNRASLSIADGAGVILVSRLLCEPIHNRIAGVDVAEAILALAARQGSRVFFLGAASGVAIQAADQMRRLYPKLNVVGTWGGGAIAATAAKNDAITEIITRTQPDILIVALGHGKQELFIDANLARLPSVHLAIGVGGAFDYWSGRVPRAPRLLRRWGFEWLYRLIREPSRLVRILRATVIFPYLALTSRIQKP